VKVCVSDNKPTKLTLPSDTLILDRYRLEKRLGQGSVGIVYLAHDVVSDYKNAIKVILPELVGNDRSFADSFLSKMTAVAAVRHPNIVNVTDSGILGDVLPFIVMEFLSGPSLQETLSARGALTPDEAFEYVSAIGSGLAAAHKSGIVHGDLKPRNILIEADRPLSNALKIIDFGLSGIKSGKLELPLIVPRISGMLRSASYLAPEEWSDAEPGTKSDIYSLGIILYQMLAGELPFKGKSIPAVMKQHLMKSPPPITPQSVRILPKLEAAVLHALEKDPAMRPATVEDFIEELRLATAGRPVKPATTTRRQIPREDAAPRKPAKHRVRTRAKANEGELEIPQVSKLFAKENVDVDQQTQLEARDLPQTNLDQTIVIGLSRADLERQMSLPDGDDAFPECPLLDQTIVVNTDRTSPENTMVPDNNRHWRDETLEESNNSSALRRSNADPRLAWPSAGAVVAVQNEQNADRSPHYEMDQSPKSLPPVVLAFGLFLVILLIAVGVYYSRVSE
jgi:serine/threonine protein kinase